MRVNNAGIAIRTHCCWRISHRRIAISWSVDKQKEGKAKFGNKPLGKLDVDQEDKESPEQERDFAPAPEDDFEIIRKDRKEPDFGMENSFDNKFASDPLIDDVLDVKEEKEHKEEQEIPAFVATKTEEDVVEPVLQESVDTFAENETIAEKKKLSNRYLKQRLYQNRQK